VITMMEMDCGVLGVIDLVGTWWTDWRLKTYELDMKLLW
jgi:hypothetical protein